MNKIFALFFALTVLAVSAQARQKKTKPFEQPSMQIEVQGFEYIQTPTPPENSTSGMGYSEIMQRDREFKQARLHDLRIHAKSEAMTYVLSCSAFAHCPALFPGTYGATMNGQTMKVWYSPQDRKGKARTWIVPYDILSVEANSQKPVEKP